MNRARSSGGKRLMPAAALRPPPSRTAAVSSAPVTIRQRGPHTDQQVPSADFRQDRVCPLQMQVHQIVAVDPADTSRPRLVGQQEDAACEVWCIGVSAAAAAISPR